MCPTGDASRHVCRGEACLARRAAWRGKTAVCTSAPRRACHPGDRRTAAVRVPAAAGRPHRARRRPTPDPRRTRAGAGGVRGWQIEHGRRNTRARARTVKPARRRAAHRAVDHPLDHQQEEGPLGSLTHQVGSHHPISARHGPTPHPARGGPARSFPQPATWRCAIPSSPAGPCRGICRAPGAAGRRTASPLQGDAIHPRSGMNGPRWVRPPVW
jgi:hypothetical protein